MKKARLLLSSVVILAVAAGAPAANAVINNCDRSDEHDIEVRYRDNCVMADLPSLPAQNV